MSERMSYEEQVKFRLQAVEVMRRSGWDKETRAYLARVLGVAERTIRRWELRVRQGKPVYEKRGRKADDVPRAKRQKVLRAMFELGPFSGVTVLRGMFSDVPYRVLSEMKRRLLRVALRRWRWYRRRLKWVRAGAVWAADFTRPKAGLWQGKDRLFLVRDLGSGAQLAAVACRGEKTKTVCAALLALITLFGAPLILKKDNAGAFRSEQTAALLEEHGITPLTSPPYTPAYNGACERSGGNFKRRVQHIAQMEGHPRIWLPQNLDDALLVANTTARPWGATGPTPAEALEDRRPITRQERTAFAHDLKIETDAALKTFKERNARMPTCIERASIDRSATQRTLCKHGYLQFRRGRLSTLVSAWRRRPNA